MRAALLIAVFFAFVPAAVAQAPDERVAAQALADAVQRLDAADRATENQDDIDDALRTPRCRRELRRSAHHQRGAIALLRVQEFRHISDRLRDGLAQMRTDLANAVTADPVLISGRAAWRRLAKAAMALPAGEDVCGYLAAWRRRGYDRASVRRARAEYAALRAASGRGWQRKIAAAADRMRELGVSEQAAKAFEGDG